MKKLLTIIAAMMLGHIASYAQHIMNVNTNDGRQIQFNVSDISSITWESSFVYEYVDLGLSVKWATCNVGATKPEDYGDYFAWGATVPLYEADYAQEDPQTHWNNGKSDGYTYANTPYQTVNTTSGFSTKWTKYLFFLKSPDRDPSATDADVMKDVLDLEDDAAHVNWGGSWRMPNKAELDELYNNCNWVWTTLNGVNGYKVVGVKPGYEGNWIFLPASGYRSGTNLRKLGSNVAYWSSSLFPDFGNANTAYSLFDTSSERYGVDGHRRNSGMPVRPVCP